MTITYRIHELTDYINWIYFFHAWGFQPRFAEIGNVHGCDACRAMWLTDFPVEDRPKGSRSHAAFQRSPTHALAVG